MRPCLFRYPEGPGNEAPGAAASAPNRSTAPRVPRGAKNNGLIQLVVQARRLSSTGSNPFKRSAQ